MLKNRPLVIYISCVLFVVLAIGLFGSRVVINDTASEPVGLYYRTDEPAGVGDYVLVAGADIPKHYPWIPKQLLKQIKAVSPSAVRVNDHGVVIDGHYLGPRPRLGMVEPFFYDASLPAGYVWLMAPQDLSFDSRHFGPVPAAALSRKVVPLWTF